MRERAISPVPVRLPGSILKWHRKKRHSALASTVYLQARIPIMSAPKTTQLAPPNTPDQAASWLDHHQAQWVECALPDLTSVARGKVMTRELFEAQGGCAIPAIILGLSVHGQEAPEIYSTHFPESLGDTRAVPDWGSMVMDPLSPRPMATVLCDLHGPVNPPDGLHYDIADIAPRQMLKRTLKDLAAAGLTAKVAPELELFLVRKNPDGSLWAASGVSGEVPHEEFSLDMLSLEMCSSMAPYFDALFAACEVQGIPLEGYDHESSLGQYEVNFAPGEALAQADAVFRFKRLARELARRHGFHATFLPKPFPKELGCGMHWHVSLVDGAGQNIFGNDVDGPDDKLMQFIAGLQRTAAGAMAICAPYPASYERIASPYASPASSAWGHDNRTVSFRIPQSSLANRRVEHRLPGGDVNPYLFLTTLIGAGLAGMHGGWQPDAPAGEKVEIGDHNGLPLSLPDALAALEKDAVLRNILGERFVRLYAAIKRFEQAEYSGPQWSIEHLLARA